MVFTVGIAVSASSSDEEDKNSPKSDGELRVRPRTKKVLSLHKTKLAKVTWENEGMHVFRRFHCALVDT